MSERVTVWEKEGVENIQDTIGKAEENGILFRDGYREEAFEIMKAETPVVTTGVEGIKREDGILYKKERLTNDGVAAEITNIRNEKIKTAVTLFEEMKKQSILEKDFDEKDKIADKQLKVLENLAKEKLAVASERDSVWKDVSLNNEKGIELLNCIESKKCNELYTNKQLREVMPKTIRTELQLSLANISFLRKRIVESYAQELAKKQKEELIEENLKKLVQHGELEKKVENISSTFAIEKKIMDEYNNELREILKKAKEEDTALDPLRRKLRTLAGFNSKDIQDDRQILN